MILNLEFDPTKATYGFLFGVARFTTSGKVLKEILNVIENFDLSKNSESFSKCFSSCNETYNHWAIEIKTMIVVNEHSSCELHKTIAKDKDVYVRWQLAMHTRYPSLIMYLCKNAKEQKVIIGLLENKNLTKRQYDIIVRRICEGDLFESLDDDDERLDDFIKYTMMKHRLVTPYQSRRLQNAIYMLYDAAEER
ncbi:MAG: hypothetical protein IKI57_05250 [Clostridia bacterium]|nr:hypothetical protein [Clostridia bacterium]